MFKREKFFDGCNIVDAKQQSLRANISVIPQDITMFYRTIYENLKIAKIDACDNEIISACKKLKFMMISWQ